MHPLPHTYHHNKAETGGLTKAFPLLELPVELYWMILRLILAPGKVYPQIRTQKPPSNNCSSEASHTATANALSALPLSQPGFQILATCKKLHDDGATIFYSENTFYLPRGSDQYAKRISAGTYFKSQLLPRHSSLIRKMAIQYSVTILNPALMDLCIATQKCRPHFSGLQNLLSHGTQHLQAAWRSSLRWVCKWHLEQIRAGESGLEELRLEGSSSDDVIVLSGLQLTDWAKVTYEEHDKTSWNEDDHRAWRRSYTTAFALHEQMAEQRQRATADFVESAWKAEVSGLGSKFTVEEWLEDMAKEEDLERAK